MKGLRLSDIPMIVKIGFAPALALVMFAVVLTVSALGFFADRAYLFFMRRTLVWRE